MRILHTADWHLGKSLRGYKREDEQFDQVERVLGLTRERDVDVLLVAGDVFDTRPKKLAGLTKRLADLLRPHLAGGLHVVLVPGNHDEREHFRMMRALLNLNEEATSRLHIVETKDVFTIDGVQFGVLPYPSRSALKPDRDDEAGGVPQNKSASTKYADLIRAMSERLAEHDGPAVFAAHVTIQGVTTPSDHEVTYRDDLILGRSDLPDAGNLAYVALGHIHQPQRIEHTVPCYYSGSIDRLDWGEWQDDKQVMLADISEDEETFVERIDLDATPFDKIELEADDVDTLADDYDDLDRAFVQVHLTCEEGDDPAALRRKIRELCPRCTNGVEIVLPDRSEEAEAFEMERPEDYAATALDYLEEVYSEDGDYDALKERTQQLIANIDHAS